jgi:transcriptional regulator with XRE-family HTH domain
MKSTDELLNEIKSTKNILDYMEHNQEEMHLNTLAEALEAWVTKKGISIAEVIKKSNLNNSYVYQIFRGKKYPSRDKVIALAFGLALSADETQKLLKQAGYRELYPRDKRDALLLFAINQKMNIIDANEALYDHEIEVLE